MPNVNGSRSSLRSDRGRGIGSIIGEKEPPVSMTNEQSATDLRSLKVESSSRIGRTIGKESTISRSAEKAAGVREPRAATRGTVGSAAGRTIGRSEGRDTRTGTERTQTDISRESKDIGISEQSVSPLRGSTRPFRRSAPQEQTTTINSPSIDSVRTDGTRLHSYETRRPSRVVYYDRPNLIGSSYHHDYAYRDYHDRICSWSVWPRFRFALYYNCGPWFSFRYVYPYYLRKYMFVSLGGYWPLDYRYTRYYWYGCHPYNWYGYYPIAREVPGSTYNYYTYNYYTNDDGSYEQAQTVNPEIFENVTEQTAEPQEATLADIYFEEAVKAFEVAQYDTAAMKFAQAMELAPEDMILPFAYGQALMASERYSKAAEVLRGALEKISPEKEGVFFPRGLYPDEDSLLKQIDRLAEQAAQFSFDADLQLLLGYQLLGIGQHDRAVEPLMNAGKDLKNAKAAGVLMDLLEKIKSAENKPETPAPAVPAPETPSPLQSPAPAPDKGVVPSTEPRVEGVPPSNRGQDARDTKASIINHSRALGGAMLVTSLCALGTSFGIKRFVRG